MNNKLNLIVGLKINKWEIISDVTRKINNLTNWLCRCDCGHEQLVPLNNLMNGSSTQCRKCSTKDSGIKRRKGCGLISGDMWSQIKRNAIKKNIIFDLRIEEAWEVFKAQENCCALSNSQIELSGYPYDKNKTTATLCFIDKELGYVKDNIIWVENEIAKMKGNLDLNHFLFIIDEIKT